MSSDVSVQGQVVIVAGASSGMGRSTARLLAESGAKVVMAARRQEDLTQLQGELEARGLEAISCPTDTRDREQVERLVRVAVDRLGRVDALVYATGINRPQRAISVLPPETWDDMVATNLTGAFHCTQALLPQMISQAGGLFVYISSGAVRGPHSAGVAYMASKHALKGLADGVQFEHHRDGIRCTILVPGLTDTPMLNDRPIPTAPEQLAAALCPDDIALACRFVVGLPKHIWIPEIGVRPVGIL